MNALVIVLVDLLVIGIASGHPVNKSMIVRICLFPLLDSVKVHYDLVERSVWYFRHV